MNRALTVTDRERVLTLAWSQRGVHESPPFSNRVKYSDWWGFAGPWCAMYASWCFYTTLGFSPFPATTSKGFAHCSTGADWFKRQGMWAPRSSRPKRGWLVFFDFGGWPRSGHIGIVLDVLPDGRLHTCEGNTNGGGSRDGGSVMEHYRSTGTVVGYGIIDYAPAPGPKPPVQEDNDMPKVCRSIESNTLWAVNAVGRRAIEGESGGATGIQVADFYVKLGWAEWGDTAKKRPSDVPKAWLESVPRTDE